MADLRILLSVVREIRLRSVRVCVLLILITLIVQAPFARASSELVSREALFQRAFSSAAYLMFMAESDAAFMESLTPDEKKMFNGVAEIAQQARNREWFLENGVENFPANDTDRRFYAFSGRRSGGEERAMPIESKVRFGLEFSSSQALFRLRPDEPVRTAMTYNGLSQPIYVNRELINRPDAAIGFSDALQIMIHEYGHKLGAAKIQAAVDSMAGKMKTYVDAQTAVFKFSGGSVTVIKFAKSRFDEWMEATYEGRYIGVNVPNRIESFRAITGEGLYAFIESAYGVTDVSRELQADLARQTRFDPHAGLPYKWHRFHQFSVRSVSVRDLGSGQFRIEVGAEHAQTLIPFLRTGDPDPSAYQPFQKIWARGEAGEYSQPRLEWTWQVTSAQPVKLNTWAKPLVYESPSVEVKRVGTEWSGRDLVLSFRVPRKIEVKGSGLVETRAFLLASVGSQLIEIEGERAAADPDLVRFRLAEAADKVNGALKTLNIEVEPKERNLARRYYVRTRLFLDQSETLQLNGVKPAAPLRLQSIEAWKGSAWSSLHASRTRFRDEGPLRFTFESTAKLSRLALELELRSLETITSKIRVGREEKTFPPGQRELEPASTTVVIPAENLTQELIGSELRVTVDLGRSIKDRDLRIRDISPAAEPIGVGFNVIEEVITEVQPERALMGVEAVNHVGQSLRTAVDFSRKASKQFQFAFVPWLRPITCEALF